MQNEPIRVAVWVAALLAAGGTMMIDISSGIDLLEAGGKALMSLSLVVGGGELARSKAWAPSSVRDIIDADMVIERAEEPRA